MWEDHAALEEHFGSGALDGGGGALSPVAESAPGTPPAKRGKAQPQPSSSQAPFGDADNDEQPLIGPVKNMEADRTYMKRSRSSTFYDAIRNVSFQRPPRAPVCTLNSHIRGLMPKFGYVQFPTGLVTRYCVVGPNSDPAQFFDLIIRGGEMWDLEVPRLILSVIGGAGNMGEIEAQVETHFCRGIVNAAMQTGGWVITGGTDSGVMGLVGKAMHKHDSRRLVPCIGVTSWRALRSRWRAQLEEVENHDHGTHGKGVDLTVVDAPRSQEEANISEKEQILARLQEHHTHCVLVDSPGEYGMKAFGTELEFRERLEQHVASRCSEKGGGRLMRVLILVNGGPVSFKAISSAVHNGYPVVVCKGSGRAADFLAALKESSDIDCQAAWDQHMTSPQDRTMSLDTVLEGGREALEELVRSSWVTIFTTADRMQDTILEALMKYISEQALNMNTWAELQNAMQLAVQWQCVRHYSAIGKRLVGASNIRSTIKWVLEFFVHPAWRHLDGGPLMRWLLDSYPEGVKNFKLEDLEPPKILWDKVETSSIDHIPHLMLWLVENRASLQVVDELWLRLSRPAQGGLVAASCLRVTAQRLQASGGYAEAIASQGLQSLADRYEGMAIMIIKGLEHVDPLEYLLRRTELLGGHHLISLAHHLECKEFVAQHFYIAAVDMLWVTPTPFTVFAFDPDPDRELQEAVRQSLWSLALWACAQGRWRRLRAMWSIPRIKSLTHGLSRIVFVATYSYFVLFAEGVWLTALSCLLYVWGLSLLLVEALQLRAKGSFREYLDVWNILDLLLLLLLLGGLLLRSFVVPIWISHDTVDAMHAVNLLPCYLRFLQILTVSERFGVLLYTVVGMAQQTMQFLVLLSIVSLGFSCSLTPVLHPSVDERWEKGVGWSFWAIFGSVDADVGARRDQWALRMYIGFLCYALLLTSNTLLVNLLIAMLNDTYSANKESSRREWAFNRVDAVLEFSSVEAHSLPPPLDLWLSIRALCGPQHSVSRRDRESYCTIMKVAPMGPEEVEVHCMLTGGDADSAEESVLFCEGVEQKARTARPGLGGEETVLAFDGIQLTKPLRFRFGAPELGYQTVDVKLDDRTWTRPLTRMEKRSIHTLAQRVLQEVRQQGEERGGSEEGSGGGSATAAAGQPGGAEAIRAEKPS